MVGTLVDRTIRGIGNFVFYDIEAEKVLNIQKGVGFQIVDNTVQGRIQTTSTAGYMVYGDNYPKGFDRQFSLQYNVQQPDVLQFKFANKFLQASSKVYNYPVNLEVYNTTIPGHTTGQIFYSVQEDDTANFSKTVSNATVKLTKVDYASFNASTDDTFAVGDNGELKFSTNLVNSYVSGYIELTLSGLELSSTPTPLMSVFGTVITTDNEVAILNIAKVKPNFEGTGYYPGNDTIDLPFFIQDIAGKTTPYDLMYTGLVIP